MEKIISSPQIKQQTSRIAKHINRNHPHDANKTVFICLLNGGFMFFSDLVKLIPFSIEIDFLRPKSYNGTEQEEMQLLKDIELDIENKHVYIVDDFLDSGNTMKFALEHLGKKNPKSLSIVTLLVRENSPRFDVPSYEGLMLTDEWVAGYGLNGPEEFNRNLHEIYQINI